MQLRANTFGSNLEHRSHLGSLCHQPPLPSGDVQRLSTFAVSLDSNTKFTSKELLIGSKSIRIQAKDKLQPLGGFSICHLGSLVFTQHQFLHRPEVNC